MGKLEFRNSIETMSLTPLDWNILLDGALVTIYTYIYIYIYILELKTIIGIIDQWKEGLVGALWAYKTKLETQRGYEH